jgi:hypothetical protein
MRLALVSLLIVLTGSAAWDRGTAQSVTLLKTPEGGIQPHAAVDGRGTLHIVYFKGDPAGGDLYYVRRRAGDAAFSSPIRVNSKPGTAIAIGSVRGGHLAVGRDGWIHIAWDASGPIEEGGVKYSPIYYTRLARSARLFEPQRAIGRTVNLDGGSLTADAAGHVHLVWHARGVKEGEANRAVYVASSDDDGAQFQVKTLTDELGACGCCGVTALADREGRLNVLYRAATDTIHRDATWVIAHGNSHRSERLGPWEFNACPMTTFALAQAPDGLVGAWQTEQQIFVATLDPAHATHSKGQSLGGSGTRAHPSIAVNRNGERLIAWTDGTGWARGGTVSWELQSAAGAREDGAEHAAPVPVWGLVSAVARPDGSFIIVY